MGLLTFTALWAVACAVITGGAALFFAVLVWTYAAVMMVAPRIRFLMYATRAGATLGTVAVMMLSGVLIFRGGALAAVSGVGESMELGMPMSMIVGGLLGIILGWAVAEIIVRRIGR